MIDETLWNSVTHEWDCLSLGHLSAVLHLWHCWKSPHSVATAGQSPHTMIEPVFKTNRFNLSPGCGKVIVETAASMYFVRLYQPSFLYTCYPSLSFIQLPFCSHWGTTCGAHICFPSILAWKIPSAWHHRFPQALKAVLRPQTLWQFYDDGDGDATNGLEQVEKQGQPAWIISTWTINRLE